MTNVNALCSMLYAAWQQQLKRTDRGDIKQQLGKQTAAAPITANSSPLAAFSRNLQKYLQLAAV